MRQALRSAVILFVLVPGLSTLLHAGVVTFDFETVGGSSTPFSYTASGLTATFTSSPDAGGFMVTSFPGFFQTLTGNVLIDVGPEVLTIAFDAPQTSISLDFGTFDNMALNVNAFLGGTGGTLVGNSSAVGSIPPGTNVPEGVLSFSGGTFDTVVLSSATPSFVIDNVTVNDASQSPAPEPQSLVLLGSGMLLLGMLARRRFPLSRLQ